MLASSTDVSLKTQSGVAEAFGKFEEAFERFSQTILDLVAGARSSSSDHREHSQQLLQAVSQLQEFGKHIRSNTADIKKQMGNVQWEVAELRTGGKERDSGAITAQSGSLLAAIGNGFENNINTLLEDIVKCSHAVQTAIEKGVDPEKSLKRKRDDEQLQEFQRQKEELEKKKKEAAVAPVMHPFTGVRVMLTAEQRAQLFKDLTDASLRMLGQ